MSTLKAIKNRLKSVSNIRKITKSMKMISAAKYSKAEKDLKATKPIGEGTEHFYKITDVKIPEDKAEKRSLLIAISSDRGLCGAVHSNVARYSRQLLQKNSTMKIACVGDRAKALLNNPYAKNFIFCASQVGKKTPTFLDAAVVANAIINMAKYDEGIIVYNKFKSVISYKTSHLIHFSLNVVGVAPKVMAYDEIDDETLESYLEFSLAALILAALKENAASELSARMTAMDNATKNASDMINKLTLKFNRGRQASVTKELIEIISGAAATQDR